MANVKLSMRDPLYNTKYKPPVAQTATSTASPELTAMSIANAPVNQTKTNVPVATLESPAKPLDIPTTPVTQVDATGAVGVAQTYLNEQQKALESAQTPVSDSEARIKELMGLRSKEAETKAQLEKQAGIQGKTDAYNKIISNIQRQTAGIQGFDDDAFYGIEEQRLDASKRDLTKGVFGAKEQQMNLQNAIARRAKVSDLQGSLASASLLQGDLESAREQIKSSLAAIYDPIKQDIQDEMFFLQRADTRLSAAQQEKANAKRTVLQAQMDAIASAENLVSDAVGIGIATADDVKQMQALSGNPEAQKAYAQEIVARAARNLYNEARAPKGVSAPDTKNFGTTDAPMWKQFNSSTGTWEDVSGVGTMATNPEQVQKSIDQFRFLRDTTKKIIGDKTTEGLYTASGPSGIKRTLGDVFVGDTKYRQLEAQTNTLRTNVMALMTDPAVKKFFGPQMSNADVTLMTAAGTTLNPNQMSPAQMKEEATRLDDLLNRMETAVRTGSQAGVNVITAPDGTQIQIID